MSLVFGILAFIVSIGWLVQLLGTSISNGSGETLYIGIDGWLSDLAAGDVSFIATIIYGVMVLYMMVCLLKGTIVFGIRIPFILKIHPLVPNKTYINSLLFNAIILMLASTSVSILSIWAFPTYLSNTYLSLITRQAFYNMPMFNGLYAERIPEIAILVISGVALIVAIIRIVIGIFRKKK